MKLINKFKSPNFNNRKFSKIKFIIIHYTALKNNKEAISYLCNRNKKVSAHYLISQKGDIFYLVDEKKRAWHAGVSYWKNQIDINSISIGIELDFSMYKSNNIFSKKLIESLKLLIKKLLKKYNLKTTDVLGHSDIAPFRKKDPGEKFPWKNLYSNNLAYYPNISLVVEKSFIKKWFDKNNLYKKKDISLFILSFIGYDTFNANSNNYYLKILITKYQMHFLQNNISGKIDNITYDFLIKHYFDLVLTKNKKNLLGS